MENKIETTKSFKKEKISKVTIARQAASCVSTHATFFKSNVSNDFKGNKFFAITRNTFEFENCKDVVTRNYGEVTSRIHIIDLDKYDYDKSVVVYSKHKKYVKVIHSDMKSFLQYSLKKGSYTHKNDVHFDERTLNAYKEMTNTETETFFNFYEKRNEHLLRITLLKNGRVIENIKLNVGYLTVIHTSKECDFKKTESREKMADRLSYHHPVIAVKGAIDIEAICVFNEADPMNRTLIDMLQI